MLAGVRSCAVVSCLWALLGSAASEVVEVDWQGMAYMTTPGATRDIHSMLQVAAQALPRGASTLQQEQVQQEQVEELLARLDAIDDGSGCQGIQDVLARRNRDASQTVVFKCHTGQICGGWSDRLAGLFGAASLAIHMNASLKVDMSELSHIFEAGPVDWTFDASTVSHQDATDNAAQFPGPPARGFEVEDLGKGVLSVNDMNTNPWTIPKVVEHIVAKKPRFVFFHGNRVHTGWNLKLTTQLKDENVRWPGRAAYRCIFDSLFAPAPSFLDSRMSLVESGPRPMRELMSDWRSDQTFALALHFRMHYLDACDTSTEEETTVSRCTPLNEARRKKLLKQLACVGKLFDNAVGYERKVLVVASDSQIVANFAKEHLQGKHGVDEVWVQDLTASVNFDKAQTDERASMLQAMQMWWLLKNAKTMVFGYGAPELPSGFSMGASIIATQQKRYYAENCKAMTRYSDMASGRF